MLDTVKINHVQHISFTQSRLTDAVSVILSELLSYEHPSNWTGVFTALAVRLTGMQWILFPGCFRCPARKQPSSWLMI